MPLRNITSDNHLALGGRTPIFYVPELSVVFCILLFYCITKQNTCSFKTCSKFCSITISEHA